MLTVYLLCCMLIVQSQVISYLNTYRIYGIVEVIIIRIPSVLPINTKKIFLTGRKGGHRFGTYEGNRNLKQMGGNIIRHVIFPLTEKAQSTYHL